MTEENATERTEAKVDQIIADLANDRTAKKAVWPKILLWASVATFYTGVNITLPAITHEAHGPRSPSSGGMADVVLDFGAVTGTALIAVAVCVYWKNGGERLERALGDCRPRDGVDNDK